MLTEQVSNCHVESVKKDLVMQFGDIDDGAIEFAGLVDGGAIEVGYYHGKTKPKNIVAISSQIGCPSKCRFCSLGDKKFVRNLEPREMQDQVVLMLQQAKQYGIDIDECPHKVSFSKSGEPLLNRNMVEGLERIEELGTSFKVSTLFPKGNLVLDNFHNVAEFASNYNKPVQMQISLISTSQDYREEMAGIRLASFEELRNVSEYWKEKNPDGRKINLSLILTQDTPVDADLASKFFSPELFRFRLRNYVPNQHGMENNLRPITRERYDETRKSFEDKGYEVGDWATPTPIEQRFGLSSNVTLRRYLNMVNGKI
jgi:adenine C2-methylase RlmN of 23S rRNA A2503 and tRNA A37